MADLSPRLVKVAPIGRTTVNAFWDGYDAHGQPVGGFGPIERDVYPENPRGEALAKIRKSAMISLRDAAKALAISAENLSGLEHGRYRFADPEDWARATETIRNLAGGTHG